MVAAIKLIEKPFHIECLMPKVSSQNKPRKSGNLNKGVKAIRRMLLCFMQIPSRKEQRIARRSGRRELRLKKKLSWKNRNRKITDEFFYFRLIDFWTRNLQVAFGFFLSIYYRILKVYQNSERAFSSINLSPKVFAHPGKVKGVEFNRTAWLKHRFALGQLLPYVNRCLSLSKANQTFAHWTRIRTAQSGKGSN